VLQDKEEWLLNYIEKLDTSNSGITSWSNYIDTSGTTSNWASPFLLPIAMKVAAQTIAGGRLDEEKYTNERRKIILDDILEGKETDYNKLDDMKKEFMVDGLVPVTPMMNSPSGEIFYMDFVFGEKWYTKFFKKVKKIFSKNKTPLHDFARKRHNR